MDLEVLIYAMLLVHKRMREYGQTADEAAMALVEDGVIDADTAEAARKAHYLL